MSFSFLLPLGLVLSVLVLGPILAHMVRRKPKRTRQFGAMLLLQRLQQKIKRRRRIRDWLLLLLRMLVVLMATIAIAQPRIEWVESDPDYGTARAVVVVVDTSMSMDQRAANTGEQTLLSQARERAASLIRDLPPGTLVGLVSVGGQAELLTPELTDDHAWVATQAEALQQGQGSTELVAGIRQARRLLDGEGGVVVVMTDEAGPVAVPGAREEIALLLQQGGTLQPEPIHPETLANLAVLSAQYGDGLEGGTVRVEVVNYGEADTELPFTVELPGGPEITAFVDVPAGESASESVTVPRVAEGGVGIVRLMDPSLKADNGFAFHLPQVGASRVLVVDGDPGPNPVLSEVYFLERALAPWGGSEVMTGGVLPDVTSMAGIRDLDPAVHQVVFLANVSDPAPAAAPLLDFVQQGGSVVISVGNNVTAERYNGSLAKMLPSPLRKAVALTNPGEPGVATAIPNTEFGFFAPFSRGGRGSFGNIRWKNLFTLEPFVDGLEVRTIMSLENGMPLLVERKLGQGSVLLFTGTLDMAWGNFPLQAVFMPLIQRLVTELGAQAGGAALREQGQVDQLVTMSIPNSMGDIRVQGPDGPVASNFSGNELSFTPGRVGAYEVQVDGAPPLAWVAVNADPLESDIRTGTPLLQEAMDVDRDRFIRRLDLGFYFWWSVLVLALLQAGLSLFMALRNRMHEKTISEIQTVQDVPNAS